MNITVFHTIFQEAQAAAAGEVQDADEHAALHFLQQWTGGEQDFTVQTSGSTGEPKLIPVTRAQMLRSAQLSTDVLHLERCTDCLVCVSVAYIAGKMLLVRAMHNNMRITVVKPTTRQLEELEDDHTHDLASFVPLQLESIMDNDNAFARLQRFKTVLIGGAAIPAHLEQRLATAQGVELWHTYGMTETISHVALRRVNGPGRSEWFAPLPGVELTENEAGCLCIRAPFITGTVETRDVVTRNGNLFRVLGRADEVVNSGGIKIFPSSLEPAVETELRKAGIGNPFFLGGIPHDQLGAQLVLVLEGEPLPAARVTSLLEALREVLPRHQAPRQVVVLEKFLRTDTGKLQKISMLEKIKRT